MMLPILFNFKSGVKTNFTKTRTVARRKLKNKMARITELNSPKYSKRITDKKALNKIPLE